MLLITNIVFILAWLGLTLLLENNVNKILTVMVGFLFFCTSSAYGRDSVVGPTYNIFPQA